MFRNGKYFFHLALSLCAIVGFSDLAAAQPTQPKPPKPKAEIYAPPPYVFDRNDGVTTEKFISVDPNVNIKLCVSEGTVKINGWERDEVRIFVKDGRKTGFRVLEKDKESGKPNWLWIATAATDGGQVLPSSECLAGERIELDVPMKAAISYGGRVTETTIDSVRKVGLKNLEGNISLRNITGGIAAVTHQGDLMVENSGGAISLETTTGNIVAFEVTPGQIGDLFKAKTNSGAITLQKLDHRQIEANSITGSVLFNGKFLAGGIYTFKTSNGSIRMMIPHDSSCKIVASYGYGSFNSDIPLEYLYRNETTRARNLAGTIGAGEAVVNLTTNSGSIGIKKQ